MKISIPTPVKNFMSKSTNSELVQNTFVAVSIETVLKMAGRPSFIYLDKKADPEAKKYASVKEFLYQGTCFGLYVALVPKIKHFISGKLIENLKGKSAQNKLDIAYFDRANDVLAKMKARLNSNLKTATNKDAKKVLKSTYSDSVGKLKSMFKENKKYHLGKGATEVSAIAASILMLAILAPQLAHPIIHPVMKALGFDKKPDGAKVAEIPKKV